MSPSIVFPLLSRVLMVIFSQLGHLGRTLMVMVDIFQQLGHLSRTLTKILLPVIIKRIRAMSDHFQHAKQLISTELHSLAFSLERGQSFVYHGRELDIWEPIGFNVQTEYDRADAIWEELQVEQDWYICHKNGDFLPPNYTPKHGERFVIRHRQLRVGLRIIQR
jgi:hypothetical protein